METQTLVEEKCPTKTQGWINAGAILVDVREPNEVAIVDFDVPNIIHIPLSEFEERYQEIPMDKQIVTVCENGTRSLRAAGFLINHGYTKVFNMKHGMIRWLQRGFPAIGDTTVPEGSVTCCSH